MIDPVKGWFEITQYDNKRAVPIANLVETMWLTRYPWTTEISYDQGSECIGHEFRKYIIEMEYIIISNPITLGYPTPNAILERIHQVLVNLVRTYNIKNTYVDEDYPLSGILEAADF